MREQKTYYFYIMAGRSRTLYCGVSGDPHKRVWQHKNHVFEGFTSDYNIARLVYYEQFYDVRNAIAREKQVKRWSRAKKLVLIERMNATWLDLSDGWYHRIAGETLRNAGSSARTRQAVANPATAFWPRPRSE